ncbi:hypothetical protein [Enterococcus faecium]|uniref:hypothetical protein n=1 Tax=Enterococcus TaxID=1350 RepID=UPI00191386CF|nr:hypothetical protein [Enterococcus faecium]MBK5028919.1 hypothetical protein [Enterococcus faecium]MBK5039638.1 hypothetical protein [Enterococcus faecium]MBK5044568.1 hypothetical protein [Enterococcus faecium]MBK5069488.1 hypothetical protein [Enterococcus faecium]MBK5132767.1 hypothetical protein [Enterococcus faecium]
MLPTPSEFASMNIFEKGIAGSKALIISIILLFIAFLLLKNCIPRMANYMSSWAIAGSGIGLLSGIAGIITLSTYINFILATLVIGILIFAFIADS